MSWQCIRSGNIIKISVGRHYFGDYSLIKKPYCSICSSPETEDSECHRRHELDWFDRVYTVGVYHQKHLHIDDDLTEHILELKNSSAYAEPLGKSMGIVAKEIFPQLLESQGLIFIPLHPDEENKRHFNQSLLLAKQLSKEINIPVIDVLEKTQPKSLQGLSFQERFAAVKGLYVIKNLSEILDKDFIIVDDVFASGATSSECAKILKFWGAKSVKVFVLGRTKYSKG